MLIWARSGFKDCTKQSYCTYCSWSIESEVETVACQNSLYKYNPPLLYPPFTCSPSVDWRVERILIFFCCWLEQERVENNYFVLVERCVSACVGQNPLKEWTCVCVCEWEREIADWKARQPAGRGESEVVIDDCWFERLLHKPSIYLVREKKKREKSGCRERRSEAAILLHPVLSAGYLGKAMTGVIFLTDHAEFSLHNILSAGSS